MSTTAMLMFLSYFARERKTFFIMGCFWVAILIALFSLAAIIKGQGYKDFIAMAGIGFFPLFINLITAKVARIFKINEVVGLLAGGGVIALVFLLVFSPGGRLHVEWIGLVMWFIPVAIVFFQLKKVH